MPQWSRSEEWEGAPAGVDADVPTDVPAEERDRLTETLITLLRRDDAPALRLEEEAVTGDAVDIGFLAWAIFKRMMASFHKLCFCASGAVLVFKRRERGPVSYTHLTLPTILLV